MDTITTIEESLKINSRKEERRIITFVQEKLQELNRDGAVIGLSGGLDSSTCAYLLEKALGKKKILAVLLPERDSSPINMDHARLVAKNLNLKTVETEMSVVLEKMGVYEVGPKELKTDKDWKELEQKRKLFSKIMGPYAIFKRLALAFGLEKENILFKMMKGEIQKITAFSFTKVRMRMVYLYYHAWLNNYAVIGTLDRSEWSIGLYDAHGDGACDIAILRHLYKSQIKQLAQDIGVPSAITEKPSSGDLYGNVAWESTMGITYKQLDQILYALEKGYNKDQLFDIAPEAAIDYIEKGLKVSHIMKSLPLSLNGTQNSTI